MSPPFPLVATRRDPRDDRGPWAGRSSNLGGGIARADPKEAGKEKGDRIGEASRRPLSVRWLVGWLALPLSGRGAARLLLLLRW